MTDEKINSFINGYYGKFTLVSTLIKNFFLVGKLTFRRALISELAVSTNFTLTMENEDIVEAVRLLYLPDYDYVIESSEATASEEVF